MGPLENTLLPKRARIRCQMPKLAVYPHPFGHDVVTRPHQSRSMSQFDATLLFLYAAFSESSDAGGELRVMTAGESGVFSSVRTGIEAGGRPVGSDGFQTFGGIRAVARYVKIEVVPPSGGSVVINEVGGQHLGPVCPRQQCSPSFFYTPPILPSFLPFAKRISSPQKGKRGQRQV